MIRITGQVAEYHLYSFTADTLADLAKLPTLKSPGKDNLNTIKSAGQGSDCLVLETSDLYMLSGKTEEGVWVVL